MAKSVKCLLHKPGPQEAGQRAQVVKEIKIKTTLRFCLPSARLAIVKKTLTEMLVKTQEKATLICCW